MENNASAESKTEVTTKEACAKCGKIRTASPARFYFGGEFQEDDQSELGKIMNRKRTFYKVKASEELLICDVCLKKYKYIRLVPYAVTGLFCLGAFAKTTIIFVNSFAAEMDPIPLPFMAFFLYGASVMAYKFSNLLNDDVLRDKIAIDLKKPSIGRGFRFFTQAEHAKFKVKQK
ncbi:MAG: hypothetical protein JXK94_15325 [Deltaproteobacteria bacterium]|nr:hypothetical protein [Deltaproteobacteria bacterium]